MLLVTTLSMLVGGFVSDVPRSAHLLAQSSPPTLSAATPDFEVRPSAEVLRARLDALQTGGPSLAGPIALLVSGGLTAVGGVAGLVLGFFVAILGGGGGVLVVGAVALTVGIGLLIGGGVMLGSVLKQRAARAREAKLLSEQLDALEASPPVPLPPEPPPSVQAPAPTLLLAQF